MALTWPVVEFVGDVIALLLSEMLHAGSLGHVLTQQTIEVLVCASLPGMIRGGEVAFEIEGLLELCIVVELSSVVQAKRFELTLVPGDCDLGSADDFFFGASLELHDDGKAADSFDQGKQAVAQVFADDGIALPVTDFDAQISLLRSLTDMTLAGQNTP